MFTCYKLFLNTIHLLLNTRFQVTQYNLTRIKPLTSLPPHTRSLHCPFPLSNGRRLSQEPESGIEPGSSKEGRRYLHGQAKQLPIHYPRAMAPVWRTARDRDVPGPCGSDAPKAPTALTAPLFCLPRQQCGCPHHSPVSGGRSECVLLQSEERDAGTAAQLPHRERHRRLEPLPPAA